MSAINKWAEEAGVDVIIIHSSAPLCIDNPELRGELLTWLLDHKEKFKEVDMKPYIQGTLACLQDRAAPIRVKAESLFSEVVECVGFESFSPFLKDIKPAVMNTLNTIFEKYRHKGPSEPDMIEGTLSITAKPRPKESQNTNRSGSKEGRKTAIPIRMSSEADLKTTLKKPEIKGRPSIDMSINVPGNKTKRLEQEAKCKWSVEDIRTDYYDKLKDQMKTCLSGDLYTLMFHNDFKKQVEGLNFLISLIVPCIREFTEILDILFKWV